MADVPAVTSVSGSNLKNWFYFFLAFLVCLWITHRFPFLYMNFAGLPAMAAANNAPLSVGLPIIGSLGGATASPSTATANASSNVPAGY